MSFSYCVKRCFCSSVLSYENASLVIEVPSSKVLCTVMATSRRRGADDDHILAAGPSLSISAREEHPGEHKEHQAQEVGAGDLNCHPDDDRHGDAGGVPHEVDHASEDVGARPVGQYGGDASVEAGPA